MFARAQPMALLSVETGFRISRRFVGRTMFVSGGEVMQSRKTRWVLGSAGVILLAAGSGAEAQNTRDPWLWPFASDSIWNTPIGSNANYQPAGFQDAGGSGTDKEYFIKTTTSDPYRTVYYPGPNTDRDSGTTVSWLGSMRVPDNLYIADSTTNPYYTPNAVSTFLQPDGISLIQLQPTTRTTNGGPIWGYPQTGDNAGGHLFSSDGKYGTHYGSGLSGIGGSIRPGELTSSNPIRHVLKINVWAAKYLYYSSSDSTPGYRWPAKNADNYANGNYAGTNPKLEQGSLLAIPWSTNIDNLGLSSNKAKKLAWTLKHFGAYITDDSGHNVYDFCIDNAAAGEWDISTSDVNKLMKALSIVDNNGPSSIGGGGTPRYGAAPPLSGVMSNQGLEAQQYNTQTPSGWSEWSDNGGADASFTESYGGSYSGGYHGTHWKNSAYRVYTYQTKTGLANGWYTLRCWAKRGSGQNACYLEAKDFGGSAKTATLPISSNYQKVEIRDINVTNGQCTIGIWSDANAGNWAYFDHFEFFKQP
jgi:hypothetical protein